MNIYTSKLSNNVHCAFTMTVNCFRTLLQQYGIWDQLRLDMGKEWTLIRYAQEMLSNYRYNLSKTPCVSASSKLVSYTIHVHVCQYSLMYVSNL